jgi:hypothetical protein
VEEDVFSSMQVFGAFVKNQMAEEKQQQNPKNQKKKKKKKEKKSDG